MALTVTIPDGAKSVFGNKRITMGTIAFDASYSTGGEALVAGDIGFDKIDFITFSSDVVQCYWTADKLEAYYGDNDNPAHAEFVEVTASDDISAANVQFFAVGR